MNVNGKQERAGSRTGWGNIGILAIVAILALPAAGAAQQHEHERGSFWNDPHGEFFLYGEGTVAAGGLHSYAGLGGGVGAGGTLFLNRARNAALRVEGRLTAYDGRFNHPPAMGMSDMRVSTDVTIFSAAIGPQVYLLTGAVRPYVYGTLGLSRLVGDVNVHGQLDSGPLGASVNLDGVGAALSAGGGLSVQVRRGNHPVAVDVSASYQNNGIDDHLNHHHPARESGSMGTTQVAGDHHYTGEVSGDHHHGGQIVLPHMANRADPRDVLIPSNARGRWPEFVRSAALQRGWTGITPDSGLDKRYPTPRSLKM